MQQQDIERVVKLLGYAIFLVVYLTWKRVGRYILKNDPDNLFLPLYYTKRLKFAWKSIYVSIGTVYFIIAMVLGLYAPYAACLAVGLSIYSGGFVAHRLQKNIWLEDQKPQLSDAK